MEGDIKQKIAKAVASAGIGDSQVPGIGDWVEGDATQ